MVYKSFDVVVVPFPFTDSAQAKRRPALILSQNANFNARIEHSVLAMITSQKNEPWPLDCAIQNKKQIFFQNLKKLKISLVMIR